MKKSEQAAVVKLIRHMQELQRQITQPSCKNATDKEVLKLFELLWEWTPTPSAARCCMTWWRTPR